MKRKIIGLVLLLVSVVANADTTLVVLKTDGGKENFSLSENPEITMKEDNCVFTTASGSISIPISNITDFHFEDGSASIGVIKQADTSWKMSDNEITISGKIKGGISLYDVSGKPVPVSIKTVGDISTIPTLGLKAGIYIIKYNDNTIKIIRK